MSDNNNNEQTTYSEMLHHKCNNEQTTYSEMYLRDNKNAVNS